MPENLTVLFLAANPLSTSRLALDEEIREIKDKLRGSTFQSYLAIEPYLAARPDDLLKAFNEASPTIVHFSGHGTSGAEILLTSSTGDAVPVAQEALTFLFGNLRHKVKIVLLNACFSEAQAQAISTAVDLTIGMRRPISDLGAISFAAAFYRAIAFGRPVQEAFNQGKAALKLQSRNEEEIPQLICKPGINPEEVTLITPPIPIDYSSLGLAFDSPIRLFFSHRMETLRPLLKGSLLLQVTKERESGIPSKDLLKLMEAFLRYLKVERDALEKLLLAVSESTNRWASLLPPGCVSKLNKLAQVTTSIYGTTTSLHALTQDICKTTQVETRRARDEKRRRAIALERLGIVAAASEPLFGVQISYTILIGNSYNEFLASLPDDAWLNASLNPVIWEFRMGDDQPNIGSVEIPESLKGRLNLT